MSDRKCGVERSSEFLILGVLFKRNIYRSGKQLHTILALDPRGNMCAPSKGTTETHQYILPLHPAARFNGTGLAQQDGGFKARVGTGGQKDQRQYTQDTAGHFRHDGAQNLGWRIFTFPVGIFRHAQRHGGGLGRRRGDTHT